MFFTKALIVLSCLYQVTLAHFVLTYPQWRGNTLGNDKQWQYPCGGLGPTTNRTKWPITGGAVAFQPGHQGPHPTALMYINMYIGNNDSGVGIIHNITLQPVFQLVAPGSPPTRGDYPGTFCFPQNSFKVPDGIEVRPGTNATIQVIQTALHGAALFNCADITFADPSEVPKPGNDICRNDTDIGFQMVFTTKSRFGSMASTTSPTVSLLLVVSAALAAYNSIL